MTKIHLELPELDFTLPEWQEHQFATMRQATKALERLTQHAGFTSDAFEESRERLEACGYSQSAVENEVVESVDVRAFTYLLSISEAFFRNIEFSDSLFGCLTKVNQQLSRLSLLHLIEGYLKNYESIRSSEERVRLEKFIIDQLAYFNNERFKGSFRELASASRNLFNIEGPNYVASTAVEKGIDLDVCLKQLGLLSYKATPFVRHCRFIYYISTLETIPVGEDHQVIAELSKKQVYESQYSESRLIGHKVIEILITRSKGEHISDVWQSLILIIAGDPRVSKTAKSYQRWWRLIDEDLIDQMRAWLSKFDLKLFLQALEDSAKKLGQSEVRRMFHSRKEFMEGLLKQELLENSRLFLSNSAESYIRREYKEGDLTDFALSGSTDTSVLYLKVGRVHMIEGSHNFRLHLMDELPTKLGILDYSRKNFYKGLEGKSPDYAYRIEYGENKFKLNYFHTRHDAHKRWQIKALNHLKKMGVNVQASECLSPDAYRKYRREYGA